MRAEAFLMDLYCDNESPNHTYNEFPHAFAGRSRADVYRQARECGWKLGRWNNRTVERSKDLCPKCSGKVKEVGK
jgi:hypothetical protein